MDATSPIVCGPDMGRNRLSYGREPRCLLLRETASGWSLAETITRARYNRKLWIEDFQRDVVYLPFEQSNGFADGPTSAERIHRCARYTTTMICAKTHCSISTRSHEPERGRCSPRPSKSRCVNISRPLAVNATSRVMLWWCATVK